MWKDWLRPEPVFKAAIALLLFWYVFEIGFLIGRLTS